MSGLRFLHASDDRGLPPGYAGDLFICDIDKTYLDTRFSSLKGLARIPFELAVDKTTIPGAVPLLRAIRRGGGTVHRPLYFVSGSPVQLRPAVERRMLLDGVDFDGITFKDQWGLARAGRWRDVKRQVGYKLRALLNYAVRFQDDARWVLIGDDAEEDAEVFLLFGEVVGGLRGTPLAQRLRAARVHEDDIAEALALAAQLPSRSDPVDRILILANRAPGAPAPEPRIVVMPTFLTGALVLAHEGRVPEDAVEAVAKDLRTRGVPESALEASVEAAQRSFAVGAELVRRADLRD